MDQRPLINWNDKTAPKSRFQKAGENVNISLSSANGHNFVQFDVMSEIQYFIYYFTTYSKAETEIEWYSIYYPSKTFSSISKSIFLTKSNDFHLNSTLYQLKLTYFTNWTTRKKKKQIDFSVLYTLSVFRKLNWIENHRIKMQFDDFFGWLFFCVHLDSRLR